MITISIQYGLGYSILFFWFRYSLFLIFIFCPSINYSWAQYLNLVRYVQFLFTIIIISIKIIIATCVTSSGLSDVKIMVKYCPNKIWQKTVDRNSSLSLTFQWTWLANDDYHFKWKQIGLRKIFIWFLIIW